MERRSPTYQPCSRNPLAPSFSPWRFFLRSTATRLRRNTPEKRPSLILFLGPKVRSSPSSLFFLHQDLSSDVLTSWGPSWCSVVAKEGRKAWVASRPRRNHNLAGLVRPLHLTVKASIQRVDPPLLTIWKTPTKSQPLWLSSEAARGSPS